MKRKSHNSNTWEPLTSGTVSGYDPLPCDTVEQRLDMFDAERTEIPTDDTRRDTLRDFGGKVAEVHDEALTLAVKIRTVTPDPKFAMKMFGISGKAIPYDPEPYDAPENDEVAQAWDELIEDAKKYVSPDDYDAVEKLMVRRLKNVLEAVDRAYTEASQDSVKDNLRLEGYA